MYTRHACLTNAVITCEIKLFQNYFSLRRRLTELILFQRVKTYLKLSQDYSRNLLHEYFPRCSMSR